MIPENGIALGIGGIAGGILAGFLGVGGGTILVPVMLQFGISPLQAVATSNLSIVLTSFAGSVQNWRMGQINLQQVLYLAFPSLATAQVGVLIAELLTPFILLLAFGLFVVANMYLIDLRSKLSGGANQPQACQLTSVVLDYDQASTPVSDPSSQELHQEPIQPSDPIFDHAASQDIPQEVVQVTLDPPDQYSTTHPPSNHPSDRDLGLSGQDQPPKPANSVLARIITGGSAGLLAGLFGIGGGGILVPLQTIWLGATIKTAIQTSLGVIVITSLSATVGHTLAGNVLPVEGLILGTGGLVGVQISTRILPKLPDQSVRGMYKGFLVVLAIYIFWKAWLEYSGS